ncbi:uncharacterized protein LOC102808205 [Saccoglossus kowalevskii]|uniref:Zinc finger protein 28-like n=1 Tax=Saccoglossus kowalevskii TaxID=10224 RepID=A0ABM0M2G8_SACKO|nr:PREDICTED: zinc finger protein 28-like [Saccoglossus kowalevskii]
MEECSQTDISDNFDRNVKTDNMENESLVKVSPLEDDLRSGNCKLNVPGFVDVGEAMVAVNDCATPDEVHEFVNGHDYILVDDMSMYHLYVCESEVVIDHTETIDNTDVDPQHIETGGCQSTEDEISAVTSVLLDLSSKTENGLNETKIETTMLSSQTTQHGASLNYDEQVSPKLKNINIIDTELSKDVEEDPTMETVDAKVVVIPQFSIYPETTNSAQDKCNTDANSVKSVSDAQNTSERMDNSRRRKRGRRKRTIKNNRCDVQCNTNVNVSGEDKTTETLQPPGNETRCLKTSTKSSDHVDPVLSMSTTVPDSSKVINNDDSILSSSELKKKEIKLSSVRRKRKPTKGKPLKIKLSSPGHVMKHKIKNQFKNLLNGSTKKDEHDLHDESHKTDEETLCDEKMTRCKVCLKLFEKQYCEDTHEGKCARPNFRCRKCDKILLTEQMLERHVLSCGQGIPDKVKEIGNFTCRLCNFTASDSEAFSLHQNSHFMERCERISKKIYTCDKCSYTCTVEKALVAHKKSDLCENTDTMLSCKICGKDFKNTEALSMHMLTHKVENGGYMCDICGAEFFTTQKVIQHRRTHTNEKPFKCEYCKYNCNRSDNLRLHIKRIHKIDPVKKVKSLIVSIPLEHTKISKCNKKRNNTEEKSTLNVASDIPMSSSKSAIYDVYSGSGVPKIALSRHLSCKLCRIEFPTKAAKLDHVKLHKDGKLYKCELCHFRSVSVSKLVDHIRCHTGEKPFCCSYCSYRCAKKDNLHIHMKLRHSGKF